MNLAPFVGLLAGFALLPRWKRFVAWVIGQCNRIPYRWSALHHECTSLFPRNTPGTSTISADTDPFGYAPNTAHQ